MCGPSMFGWFVYPPPCVFVFVVSLLLLMGLMFIFVDRILHPALIYSELSWFHLCLLVCGRGKCNIAFDQNWLWRFVCGNVAPLVLHGKIGGGRNKGRLLLEDIWFVGYWMVAGGG